MKDKYNAEVQHFRKIKRNGKQTKKPRYQCCKGRICDIKIRHGRSLFGRSLLQNPKTNYYMQ